MKFKDKEYVFYRVCTFLGFEAMKKFTVKDIAIKAGVSQSTVSKVLNNYPGVGNATRKKVLDAIEELGFVPDMIARSMVKKKTNTIGLIVGDIANPFFSEIAKIIIMNAKYRGYDVILSDTDYKTENFRNALMTMLARRVDGIIIGSVERNDKSIDLLINEGFPFILINRKTEDEKLNYVVLDNEKGARMAMEHLITLGHNKIAFISGPKKYSTFHHRYIGYKNTLEKYRIKYRPDFVFDSSEQPLDEYINKILSSTEKPTAFFAASDQLAIRVMALLHEKGYKIPEDFSIIGFDNTDFSANPFINLTTVSQNKTEMATIALEKLIQLIDGEISKSLPIHVILEPELIVRKTTSNIKKIKTKT